MSLKHILLGMLHEPASGYDLKKEFGSSLRHFWAAELSQIYPLLRRLEQEGLLTSRPMGSNKGPQRKLYQRTETGTQALIDWLAEGPRVAEERRHYLAQVFFLDAYQDPHKALTFMVSLREAMAAKLEALQAADQRWRDCDPGYPDGLPDRGFYPHLTLGLGLRIFAAHVEWCEECMERIRARC